MKKFTKICLIASLVMILTGGTICTIGAVSGGWRLVDEIGRNSSWWHMGNSLAYSNSWLGIGGEITRDILHDVRTEISHDISDEISSSVKDALEYADDYDDWDDDWDGGYDWHDWDDDWNHGHTTAQGTNVTTEYMDIGVGASEIKDMEISIGGAALYFQESDNDSFGVKMDGKRTYKYYVSKGTLYLQGSQDHTNVNIVNEEVYLFIPKGMRFNEVDINIGAGTAELGELAADDVDLNTGAGIINASKIECRSLNLAVGAGKAELKGIDTDELDIVVGVGNATIEADVSREIEAECGMGFLDIKLANAQEDYNYELSCNAGNIELGNKKYSGLSKEKYINNNAAGKCSLECAMGGITVSYLQDL